MPTFAPPPPGFSRADLHLHTTFSDGTASPAEVLNYVALRTHCTVLAITDHDTIDGALAAWEFLAAHPDLYGQLELIVGEEVSTRDGHVLGLFLEKWIPPGMSAVDTVGEIHRQGGIAVAAHPYTSWMRWAGLQGVGDLIETLPFDAIETRNANFTEVFANPKASRRAGARAQTGSSDGHFLEAVGRCFTDFPGRSAADLRRAIERCETVPGGRCYGALTLLRYAWGRLREGGTILPRRRDFRLDTRGGELQVLVHRESAIDAAVLALVGRLDAGTMSHLKEKLVLLGRARVGMVLDLSAVSAMDGTGASALVAGMQSAREGGVGFCIVAPSAAATEALRRGRLLGVVPRARRLGEARRRVVSRAPPLELPPPELFERLERGPEPSPGPAERVTTAR